MRYRGGGVGHKSICEATCCLLHDRDPLDKVPFTRDSEKARTARNSDEMMEDGDSEEEGEGERDNQLSDNGDEQEEEEEATEVGDDSVIPFPAEQLTI